MEILIKQGITTSLGRCITSTSYDIFSVHKLYAPQVQSLIRSIDAGQDLSYKEVEINSDTSISYKYKYEVTLVCDSSD